jgi:hypothetical protein
VIYYRTAEGVYGYVRTQAEVPDGATVLEAADYPGPFWFVAPGSYGETSNASSIPSTATELITKADYEALVAQALADQAAEAAAELQASYQRYRDAYAEARTIGLGQVTAMAIAAQAGMQPPDFDPTWPPLP